jgi:hypothetical protein
MPARQLRFLKFGAMHADHRQALKDAVTVMVSICSCSCTLGCCSVIYSRVVRGQGSRLAGTTALCKQVKTCASCFYVALAQTVSACCGVVELAGFLLLQHCAPVRCPHEVLHAGCVSRHKPQPLACCGVLCLCIAVVVVSTQHVPGTAAIYAVVAHNTA